MTMIEINSYVRESSRISRVCSTKQYTDAIIAVITSNGLIDLTEHDFKLLYARREDNDDRIIARIVAVKDGVIEAKIEPVLDGEDQTEAFKALKKDVEVKLDQILREVPDRQSTTVAVAGSSRRGPTSPLVDAPPAYGSRDVGMSRKH